MALLTRQQLADALQVSTRTVQNLEKRGLPVVRVGADPRYDLEQVQAWIEEPVMQVLRAYCSMTPEQRYPVDYLLKAWNGNPPTIEQLDTMLGKKPKK